jgi:hypothetical protein
MKTENEINEKVISRLRASKELAEEHWEQEGRAAGRKWAEKAEYGELDRLRSIYDPDRGWNFCQNAARHFCALIDPYREIAQEPADFWESRCGERNPNHIFVEAFADAALEFLEEVESKL